MNLLCKKKGLGMKNLSVVVLAMTLIVGGGQQALGMDSQPVTLAVAGVDVSQLDSLLKDQNYYMLKRLLKPIYDKGTTGQQLAVERWTTAKLQTGMDPFLLYMNARQLFRGAGRDDSYSKGFKDLMLSLALTSVAKEVVQKQGKTVSLDVALFIKEKFRTEYASRALSGDVLALISFENVRSRVIRALQALHDSDEDLRALPLPHWVDKISTVFFGWQGLWWGALTQAELNTRNTDLVLTTIVSLTKTALAKHIQALEAIDSWHKFLGESEEVIAVEEIASSATAADCLKPNPGMLARIFSFGSAATPQVAGDGEKWKDLGNSAPL